MPKPTEADVFSFVMGFVSGSKEYKSQFIDRWREVLANFIVDPVEWSASTVNDPYRNHNPYGTSRGIVLKDAETHKAVMTYAAKLVSALLGDGRNEYIHANPVGYEDAPAKAPTTTRLLRYAFGLPGVFRSLVEAIVDMLLFGTSVVEIPWKYLEREQPIREFSSVFGVEVDQTTRGRVVAYDDIALNVVDNADFFPDPGEYRLEHMAGVAKRFRMNALQARNMADAGIYSKEAVDRAINNLSRELTPDPTNPTARVDENFREGIDSPENRNQHDDFVPMIGFEYWGDVPWEDDLGSSRRVITVLMGEVVRNDPYPLADPDLPFRSLTINPVVGRFYGVSPAEVIRWDQSLQDAMSILLAESVIRQVHPPIAYDPDSEIDLARLRRWQPDIPIPARGGPSAIGAVRYDAGVFNGFNLAAMKKQQMQEASGALAAIQGQEGPDREAATVGALRFQNAGSRVELAATVLEKDAMPGIGKSIIRRYQQFLQDSNALRLRIGDLPGGVWIGDVMGDFDVQFVGSRQAQSRAQKLQMYDRLVSLAAVNPAAAALVPWPEIFVTLIGDVMELPEVASRVAQPDVVQKNALLSQAVTPGQGAGNGNRVPLRSEPSGTLPAQAGGASLA